MSTIGKECPLRDKTCSTECAWLKEESCVIRWIADHLETISEESKEEESGDRKIGGRKAPTP